MSSILIKLSKKEKSCQETENGMEMINSEPSCGMIGLGCFGEPLRQHLQVPEVAFTREESSLCSVWLYPTVSGSQEGVWHSTCVDTCPLLCFPSDVLGPSGPEILLLFIMENIKDL